MALIQSWWSFFVVVAWAAYISGMAGTPMPACPVGDKALPGRMSSGISKKGTE